MLHFAHWICIDGYVAGKRTVMNPTDWDDVRYFLAAARTGSLAAASRELGCHQPTVGRRIDNLEASLGVRLFQRHSLGLTLTEEGRRVMQTAEAMSEAALKLLLAGGAEAGIRGIVRIAAPNGLAMEVIAPALHRLHEHHPDLDIELQASAASADLTHGEADIGIRLYRPAGEDLVVRQAGVIRFGLYGATEYLRVYGSPENVADLPRHRFIGYGPRLQHLEENTWLESLAGEARFVMRSDNVHMRLSAARGALGMAVLPHFLAQRVPQLTRLLANEPLPLKPICLTVHRDLRHLTRVRVVLDWLTELFSAPEFRQPDDTHSGA